MMLIPLVNMKTWVKKMPEHIECFHEEQIQGQSRKIAALETRANYKEKRIDELSNKMDKMDNKLDEILEEFNNFKMQSNQDDTELELRLKAIETELVVQKQNVKVWISILGIFFTLLTFYFQFIH